MPGKFLADTTETRKQCNDMFKVLKEHNCQTKLRFTVKYTSKVKVK